jgi:hypothetical protein
MVLTWEHLRANGSEDAWGVALILRWVPDLKAALA